MVDFAEGYTKRFTLRRPVKTARYLEVGIPWIVIEREAKKHNMTVEDFIDTHDAECCFNNFDGVHYQFIPKEKENADQGNK